MYCFVVFAVAVLIVSRIILLGILEVLPFYMFFFMLPVMLIGGGLEEAGWRYILQPEFEKKVGFIAASLIVSVIWALWHLPLFFTPGVAQYGADFLTYAVSIVGVTFLLGAVYKISGKVFPCILAHCMINAGLSVFISSESLWGVLVVTGILVSLSIAAEPTTKRADQRRRVENTAKAR